MSLCLKHILMCLGAKNCHKKPGVGRDVMKEQWPMMKKVSSGSDVINPISPGRFETLNAWEGGGFHPPLFISVVV